MRTVDRTLQISDLLLGAVLGIWLFQHSIEPVPGETVVKGQLVTAENLTENDPKDLPTENFRPTATQGLASIDLILLDLGLTAAIARLGHGGGNHDPG